MKPESFGQQGFTGLMVLALKHVLWYDPRMIPDKGKYEVTTCLGVLPNAGRARGWSG